jgi:nucleoside-diphosphate-sugar epimerase
MFHAVYNMDVATARIFMVYGPGQKELQKMIPYVCLSAIAGKNPELMSGSRQVDWVYVDDVAAGLVHLLMDGPCDGSLVDIGTGTLVSTAEVAEIICQKSQTGVTPAIGAIPDRAMEQIRKADTENTKHLIGWRSRITLEEGLERTLAWYKQTYAT